MIFMVWKDPSEPDYLLQEPQGAQQQQQQPYGGMSSGLPPMSSYGPAPPTWTAETMKLLVNIEIPKEIMNQGSNKNLIVWYKEALMQLQFGNYTAADQRRMIKHLRYILFLAQQEGNEQIVIEEQLMFISELEISKGRSDKPDGLRERTMWIMQVIKNIFGNDEPKRPEENKSTWNLPFVNR
jgi:hypothetical protein